MLIDKTKSIGQLQNLVMGGRGGGGNCFKENRKLKIPKGNRDTLGGEMCVCVCVCVENFYVEKTP